MMISEERQKNLLEQNWKPLQLFSNSIFDTITNSRIYKVGDYCGTMGCKLIFNNRYINKSDIKGVYVVFLRYKDYLIVLYVGESDKSLGTRIGRLIKQAAGDNRDDESHSAGQLLYEKFTAYGREDIWRDNLYVKFITLSDIKKILGNTCYSISDVYGEEFYKVKDLNNKIILKFFESKMIDKFGPIANKMSQSFKNTDLYSKNITEFNVLCNSVEKNVSDEIKSKPWFNPNIDKFAVV